MVTNSELLLGLILQGRIPGTDRWRPVNEDPDVEESVSGVLVVRIRENLDFANTAQLKGVFGGTDTGDTLMTYWCRALTPP